MSRQGKKMNLWICPWIRIIYVCVVHHDEARGSAC